MSNKLSDWLPLLEHPEVGERICKVAGISPYWLETALEPPPGASAAWSQVTESALAFGTLAVLVQDRCAMVNGVKSLEGSDFVITVLLSTDPLMQEEIHAPTFPAAVLAAAKRVWLEGDNNE